MRMNSILLLSVLFVQMFSSCNDNENETNIPVVEKEVSYPHRYYIDPENGAYYNTGHSPSQAWESMNRFFGTYMATGGYYINQTRYYI